MARVHTEASTHLQQFKQPANQVKAGLKAEELKQKNKAAEAQYEIQSVYFRTFFICSFFNIQNFILVFICITHQQRAASAPTVKTQFDKLILIFVAQHPEVPIENTTDCLSTMASVCKVMLDTP